MRGGQSLELDARPRHVEPIVQVSVAGRQLLHLGVGLENVLRIAGERDPAERPDAATEQRPDIGRHEARKIERVLDALLERHLPDVVAIVDRRDAGVKKSEHGAHMLSHRGLGGALDALRIA